MLDPACGGDVDHPATNLDVAGWVIGRRDSDSYTGVALDILEFQMRLYSVDDDMFAISVHPGLGKLGGAVGHDSGEIASAGLAQQFKQVFWELHRNRFAFWVLGQGCLCSDSGLSCGLAGLVRDLLPCQSALYQKVEAQPTKRQPCFVHDLGCVSLPGS